MRIPRGLSSKCLPCGCLPCGCLAGVYETYEGFVVTILDAKGSTCAESSHRDGNIVPDEPSEIGKTSIDTAQSSARPAARD